MSYRVYKNLDKYIERWKKMEDMGCSRKSIEMDMEETLKTLKVEFISEVELYGF